MVEIPLSSVLPDSYKGIFLSSGFLASLDVLSEKKDISGIIDHFTKVYDKVVLSNPFYFISNGYLARKFELMTYRIIDNTTPKIDGYLRKIFNNDELCRFWGERVDGGRLTNIEAVGYYYPSLIRKLISEWKRDPFIKIFEFIDGKFIDRIARLPLLNYIIDLIFIFMDAPSPTVIICNEEDSVNYNRAIKKLESFTPNLNKVFPQLYAITPDDYLNTIGRKDFGKLRFPVVDILNKEKKISPLKSGRKKIKLGYADLFFILPIRIILGKIDKASSFQIRELETSSNNKEHTEYLSGPLPTPAFMITPRIFSELYTYYIKYGFLPPDLTTPAAKNLIKIIIPRQYISPVELPDYAQFIYSIDAVYKPIYINLRLTSECIPDWFGTISVLKRAFYKYRKRNEGTGPVPIGIIKSHKESLTAEENFIFTMKSLMKYLSKFYNKRLFYYVPAYLRNDFTPPLNNIKYIIPPQLEQKPEYYTEKLLDIIKESLEEANVKSGDRILLNKKPDYIEYLINNPPDFHKYIGPESERRLKLMKIIIKKIISSFSKISNYLTSPTDTYLEDLLKEYNKRAIKKELIENKKYRDDFTQDLLRFIVTNINGLENYYFPLLITLQIYDNNIFAEDSPFVFIESIIDVLELPYKRKIKGILNGIRNRLDIAGPLTELRALYKECLLKGIFGDILYPNIDNIHHIITNSPINEINTCLEVFPSGPVYKEIINLLLKLPKFFRNNKKKKGHFYRNILTIFGDKKFDSKKTSEKLDDFLNLLRIQLLTYYQPNPLISYFLIFGPKNKEYLQKIRDIRDMIISRIIEKPYIPTIIQIYGGTERFKEITNSETPSPSEIFGLLICIMAFDIKNFIIFSKFVKNIFTEAINDKDYAIYSSLLKNILKSPVLQKSPR